jgi:hypothetical protein
MLFVLFLLIAIAGANATQVEVEISLDEPKDCEASACTAGCKKHGIPFGKCDGGRCLCPVSSEKPSTPICKPFNCQNHCVHLSFIEGVCKDNTCYCVLW